MQKLLEKSKSWPLTKAYSCTGGRSLSSMRFFNARLMTCPSMGLPQDPTSFANGRLPFMKRKRSC